MVSMLNAGALRPSSAAARLLSALTILLVATGLSGCGAINRVPTLEEQAKSSWSEVQNQYQRRADLIPNLVETVKAYAAHEKDTLDAVIRARNAAIAAPSTPGAQAEADGVLTGALKQVFALSEAYPDLKANTNFLALQEELTATEGRVAYARQFYNDSVLAYNNSLQQFPTVIFARMMKFDRREYFEADAGSRDAPKVQF